MHRLATIASSAVASQSHCRVKEGLEDPARMVQDL
jgi:hypothetical protein